MRLAQSMKKSPNNAPQGFTDLRIKLLPRSSRNQIVGKEDDVLKIKVTSPPVGGAANRALIDLLAKSLKLPKENIELISGKTSKIKSVRIYGLSRESIHLPWEDKSPN